MLSSLPKLADKAFILGFFMPVLLFLVGVLALFSDTKPLVDLMAKAGGEGGVEKITYAVLLVWSIAVLMMLANHSLFRLYEGYLPPISRWSWLKARERRRYEVVRKREETQLAEGRALRERYDSAQLLEDNDRVSALEPELAEARAAHDHTLIELNTGFPSDPRWLMPTPFGNAIRAFETYSTVVYGADGVPIWLRLASVVPTGFQAAIEDARAQVNFLVNIVSFSLLLAVLAACRAVWGIRWPGLTLSPPFIDFAWMFAQTRPGFFLLVPAFVLLAWGAHAFSVSRVQAWGELVKSAFDCYLPDLAKRLGYDLPKKREDQLRFWEDVSRRAIYGIPFKPENWSPVSEDEGGAEAGTPEASGADEDAASSD